MVPVASPNLEDPECAAAAPAVVAKLVVDGCRPRPSIG